MKCPHCRKDINDVTLRVGEFRKRDILNELKKKDCTVVFLYKKLKISRGCMRYYRDILIKENKIKEKILYHVQGRPTLISLKLKNAKKTPKNNN